MTTEQVKKLQVGDVIQHLGYGLGYIVTRPYNGKEVIAVRTASVSNGSEWKLVKRHTDDTP